MVLRVHGDIDVTNRHEVLAVATVRDEADPDPGRIAIVDLSEVTYLDSAAVQMIFELFTLLTGTGMATAIVRPAVASLRKVLSITQVDDVVPCADTVDEALALCDGASVDTGT